MTQLARVKSRHNRQSLNILDRLVAAETFPTPTIWVAIYPDNVRQSAYGVGRWDGGSFRPDWRDVRA
jgi:hypothetical protein